MLTVRHWILAFAMVATLVASWVEWPATEVVQPVAARPRDSSKPRELPAQTAGGPLSNSPTIPSRDGEKAMARARAESVKVDLFAPHQWQPPPKASAPVARHVAEMAKAPPLPFQYIGKVMDGPDIQVFVNHGTVTHLLRKGDVQAGYKVEEITPSEMTLVYLQLNEKQRLTFGSAN